MQQVVDDPLIKDVTAEDCKARAKQLRQMYNKFKKVPCPTPFQEKFRKVFSPKRVPTFSRKSANPISLSNMPRTFLTGQSRSSLGSKSKSRPQWKAALAPALANLVSSHNMKIEIVDEVIGVLNTEMKAMVFLNLHPDNQNMEVMSTIGSRDVHIGCPTASLGQYAIFFSGLYLMALGACRIKPCVPSFGADQFDDTDHTERVKKGLISIGSFFSISIGSYLASTLIVWIQENVGWSIGFTVPALFMGLGLACFFSRTRFYRFQKPRGSPLFTQIYQDVVASIFKVKQEVPNDTDVLYEITEKDSAVDRSLKMEHNEGLMFLDIVAVPSYAQMNLGDISNPRISNNVKQLTILLRMFPIWVTGIFYSAVYTQTSTVFVEQGMAMNRSIGSFTIPAASLPMFIMIAGLLWVPLYDKFLLPFAIKFTGTKKGVLELRRVGIGFFLSILPMLCAALVELRQLQLVM